MVYVYTARAGRVTIFSILAVNSDQFGVTCFYSSIPFLCTLATISTMHGCSLGD